MYFLSLTPAQLVFSSFVETDHGFSCWASNDAVGMYLGAMVGGNSHLRASESHSALCVCVCVCMCMLVTQSCLNFATPWTVACQAPLSMAILQARILEWVAMPFSRGSSWPRDWTQVSNIAERFFTIWTTWEALELPKVYSFFFLFVSFLITCKGTK